ncbi:MAG: YkgJ family cysteine cluster protein, partial [Fibrobacteres bacterium]|nr:YkgJ family cysteine cluster protein [Fibrobacterota bacterium]
MYPPAQAENPIRAAILLWRNQRASVSGPMGLAGLARHAGALIDAIAPEAIGPLAARGQTVSCAKGCGACCRQAVPLSPADVLLLDEAMEAMPQDRRNEVEAGFVRIGQALREADLFDAPLLDRGAEYFALRLPCPFLSEEACGAHSHRPLVCREHLVSSPSEWCGNPFGRSVRMVDVPVSVGEAVAEMVGGLLSGREDIPLARFPA